MGFWGGRVVGSASEHHISKYETRPLGLHWYPQVTLRAVLDPVPCLVKPTHLVKTLIKLTAMSMNYNTRVTRSLEDWSMCRHVVEVC